MRRLERVICLEIRREIVNVYLFLFYIYGERHFFLNCLWFSVFGLFPFYSNMHFEKFQKDFLVICRFCENHKIHMTVLSLVLHLILMLWLFFFIKNTMIIFDFLNSIFFIFFHYYYFCWYLSLFFIIILLIRSSHNCLTNMFNQHNVRFLPRTKFVPYKRVKNWICIIAKLWVKLNYY